MDKFLNRIYKSHITRNAYPVFLYWVAFVLIMSIVCAFGGNFTRNEMVCHKAKMDMGYSYVIESTEPNNKYFSYYKLENLVLMKNGTKTINANFYIQTDSRNEIEIIDRDLKAGEIVISEKIAKKINVSVGETIDVYLPLYDDSKTYTIVELLPYMDDYYDFKDDYDFSVAVIGYDDIVVSHSRGMFVGFFDEELKNNFVYENALYSNMRYFASEAEMNETKIMAVNIILSSIVALLFIAYSILINLTLKNEWDKYFKDVIGLKKLRKIMFFDKVLFVAAPALVIITILLVLSFFGVVQTGFASVVATIYTILSIVNFVWRDEYGKAF